MKKIILILIIVATVILAQILLKLASREELYSFIHLTLISISIVTYGIGFVLSPILYSLMPISQVVPIISISSITTSFLAGHFLFNEVVLPKDVLAIFLAACAILILAGRGSKK